MTCFRRHVILNVLRKWLLKPFEMVMNTTSFCRRCSVVRVNTLCRLHEQGFKGGDREARKALKALVSLAADRGYMEGKRVLQAGLDPSALRALCWNISSLLTDDDFQSRGIELGIR